jgi:RNA polymerase sigma factor for flagellar operon FliA
MTDQTEFERLFLEHLPYIDRVLAGTARVLGFRGDDAEEFASWARERLWEHDYELLRKWRGQSKLTTYLGAVVVNLGRDFRVKQWGRWRPSAAAVAMGPLGVRLEKLVHRDGWTLAQAAELLRNRGETDHTDRELTAMLARIPRRERPRAVDDADGLIEQLPGGTEAEGPLADAEAADDRRTVRQALTAAIATLDPHAQATIRMHFLHGRSLADVARALETPQKPLYRVKDGALRMLRAHLEAVGVTWERARDLLGGALTTDEAAASH